MCPRSCCAITLPTSIVASVADSKRQKNRLDDYVTDFEILLEYMLRGNFPDLPGNVLAVNQCMSFIEYADKYGMGEICNILYEPPLKALQKSPQIFGFPKRAWRRIEPADVKLVFHVAPADSSLRTSVTADVVSSQGIKGIKFVKQEEEIKDFATESGHSWTYPITGETKGAEWPENQRVMARQRWRLTKSLRLQ